MSSARSIEAACLFGFVSREVALREGGSTECRLQRDSFGAERRSCFVRLVRLGGEGLDLTSGAVSSAAWIASFWDVVCENASYLSWRLAWPSWRVLNVERTERTS